MTDDTATRPVRMCDGCGGVDDHPRHVFAHAPGDGSTDSDIGVTALKNALDDAGQAAVLRHIQDDSTTMLHMDCCRERGCPDGTCGFVTAGAEDLKGDDLVKHLTSGGN